MNIKLTQQYSAFDGKMKYIVLMNDKSVAYSFDESDANKAFDKAVSTAKEQKESHASKIIREVTI